MPSNDYKTTPLFGGALTCDLPANFADVRYAFSFPGEFIYQSST